MADAAKADGVERRHALVVGIDHYVDPRAQLFFSAADARRLADVLAARGYHVQLVHDGPGSTARPTLAEVTAAIDRLVDAADGDDLVIAYFSCHGTLVDDRPTLLMADTPSSGAGGLALADLLGKLRAKPRWVAVFLDVCHMGITIDPSIGKSADHSLEKKGGFALLSGSTTVGITQDGRDGGVFSKVLHQALAGAAADTDGSVRFSAVARHVQVGVEAWRQSPEGKNAFSKQTPVLRLEVADLVLLPAQPFRTLRPEHPSPILCAAFAPGSPVIATGCQDGVIRFWSSVTCAPLREDRTDERSIVSLAFSPDGRYLEAARLRGLDTTISHLTASDAQAPPVPAPSTDAIVRAVIWSSPGGTTRALATIAGIKRTTAAMPTGTWRLEQIVDDSPDPDGKLRGLMTALACAPDAIYFRGCSSFNPPLLWSGHEFGVVRRWRTDGSSVAVGHLDVVVVRAIAVSADALFVAAGGGGNLRHFDYLVSGGGEPGDARIWSALTGQEVARLTGHQGGVTGLAYAVDGRLAMSCGDGVARIYDGRTGALVQELTVPIEGDLRRREALCVCWSTDGKTLFVGYDDGCGRLFAM